MTVARRMTSLLLLVMLLAACGRAGPSATSSPAPSGSARARTALPTFATSSALARAIDPSCSWKVTAADKGVPSSPVYLSCRATGTVAEWAPPTSEAVAATTDDALDAAQWWCSEEGVCDQPMVFGHNWFVIIRAPDQTAGVVTRTGGYLVPSPGNIPDVCERETSAHARVFVTVSTDALVATPSTVPAGQVWLCWRTELAGRAALFVVRVGSSIDTSHLVGAATVRGSDLMATGHVTPVLGAADTFESGGPYVSHGGQEMEPGHYLIVGQMVPPQGNADPTSVQQVVGHAALLTVLR